MRWAGRLSSRTQCHTTDLIAAVDEHAARIGQSSLGAQERFNLAERLTSIIYPPYKFSEFGRLWLGDEVFFTTYRKAMDRGNWHSADRKFLLKELLRGTDSLGGDFAECGTYRGGSAVFMCDAAMAHGRTVHLFDSFMGLSQPEKVDGDYWKKGSLACTVDSLHETLAGYENYKVYEGWIPDRFADVRGKQFAFVHIDVDLYQPTFDSLNFFYPRLLPGALILLDDHGFASCPGARAAAIDFFQDKPEPVMDMPTGQGLVIVNGKGGRHVTMKTST